MLMRANRFDLKYPFHQMCCHEKKVQLDTYMQKQIPEVSDG